MSKLSSTNDTAGAVTAAASTNSKFTNVGTATANLNQDNVRSEGIDHRTLSTYANGRLEPVVYVDYTSNADSSITSFDYTLKDGENAFAINHGDDLHLDWSALPGGGLTIKDGDLVRIHFNVFLNKIDDGAYATYGPAGNNTNDRKHNRPDPIGVLFFPMWLIDASVVFSPITNEALWNKVITAPDNIRIDNTTKKSDSIAFCSMEGYLEGGDCLSSRCVHGSWAYVHTGADMLLKQLRLYCRGPMVYQFGGVERVFRAPLWGTGRYGAGFLEIPSAGNVFTITLSNGSVGIMVMRGDS